jgi:hypothetical protein
MTIAWPRRQLRLFVPSGGAAAVLEPLRAKLDPIQARLIPAHVTLCRDEETVRALGDGMWARRQMDLAGPLALKFGAAERFDGHGVRLTAVAGLKRFAQLRAALLGPGAIRTETPHLTLAHPRNPRAAANSDDAVQLAPMGFEIAFPAVMLIAQDAAATPWRVVDVLDL